MKTLLKTKLSVKRMTVVNLSGTTRKAQGRLSYPTTGTMSISL